MIVAGRGDDAGRQPHVVAVADHDRQRDHAHGDDGRRHRAGDGTEDRADDDDGVGEAAGDFSEQLAGAFEQIFSEPQRSRIAPMKVKNGIDSSRSLEMIP